MNRLATRSRCCTTAVTRTAARTLRKAFCRSVGTCRGEVPEALHCLVRDRKPLLTFYDFPVAHWQHLRTIGGTESTFVTVRLRTRGPATVSARRAGFVLASARVERVETLAAATRLPETGRRQRRCELYGRNRREGDERISLPDK